MLLCFLSQAHVSEKHMDELMGYSVRNTCRVCGEKCEGYAQLKDHVQVRSKELVVRRRE